MVLPLTRKSKRGRCWNQKADKGSCCGGDDDDDKMQTRTVATLWRRASAAKMLLKTSNWMDYYVCFEYSLCCRRKWHPCRILLLEPHLTSFANSLGTGTLWQSLFFKITFCIWSYECSSMARNTSTRISWDCWRHIRRGKSQRPNGRQHVLKVHDVALKKSLFQNWTEMQANQDCAFAARTSHFSDGFENTGIALGGEDSKETRHGWKASRRSATGHVWSWSTTRGKTSATVLQFPGWFVYKLCLERCTSDLLLSILCQRHFLTRQVLSKDHFVSHFTQDMFHYICVYVWNIPLFVLICA